MQPALLNILDDQSGVSNIPITSIEKETPCFPHKLKETFLTRHVDWLSEERIGATKIAFTVLKIVELSLLFFSIIGIPILYRAVHYARKIQSERDFYFSAALKPKPNPQLQIEFKTHLETFNHTHDFIIQNEILWTRKRGTQANWEPVYFSGRTPLEFSCDGANLIVLDETRRVHYKKILREFREHPEGAAADKSKKNNWKENWFSLPYLHHFLNLFTSKHLILPTDIRAWAISHRGLFNNFLEDGFQKLFVRSCSTLYVLDKLGKYIRFFDPWSPKHADLGIHLPETENTSYEADNMSASASTIMVIGYESRKDEPVKQLKIFTRLADIESLGWHPFCPYDYFPHDDIPDLQVIPLPSWQEHTLPKVVEEGRATVTKNIMIMQTGEGNSARRMFVDGNDENGVRGIYYKNLNDVEWKFQPHSRNIDLKFEDPMPLQKEMTESFSTNIHSYSGQENTTKIPITLENFGKTSEDYLLNMKIEGKDYPLHIYPKKTLWNFVGFFGDSYDLVIRDEDPALNKIFNGQKVIPVRIHDKGGELTIKPAMFYKSKFAFHLKQKS